MEDNPVAILALEAADVPTAGAESPNTCRRVGLALPLVRV